MGGPWGRNGSAVWEKPEFPREVHAWPGFTEAEAGTEMDSCFTEFTEGAQPVCARDTGLLRQHRGDPACAWT